MTDGNVAGIVGAGLSIVALGAVAKIATDMTKETGKLAKGETTKTSVVKTTKYTTGSVSDRAIKKILG